MAGRFPSLLVAVLLLAAAVSAQGCPGQGASLEVSGGRLADPLMISVNGTSGATGLLGFDTGGGPTGGLCLDLGPDLGLLPVTLGPTGSWSFVGLAPPDPNLDGISIFLQGAILDSIQPSGVALTNGDRLDFRSPHVYFWNNGGLGWTSNAIGALNIAQQNTTFFNPYSLGLVKDAIYCDAHRWLLTVRDGGPLAAVDRDTGVVVFWVANFLQSFGDPAVALSPDESLAVIFLPAVPLTPFNPAQSARLQVVNLPSGTLGPTINILGNAATEFIVHPQSTLAYCRDGASVVTVDYQAQIEYPVVNLSTGVGTIADWVISDATLFALVNENGVAKVNGIQLATNQAIAPNPIPIGATAPGTRIRSGPGSAGTSLYVVSETASQIIEVSPASLNVLGTMTVPGQGAIFLEASSLGTEWLLARNSTPPEVLRLDPIAQSIVPLGLVPGGALVTQLYPVRSDILGLAYLVAYPVVGQPILLPIATDPATIVPQVGTTFPTVVSNPGDPMTILTE